MYTLTGSITDLFHDIVKNESRVSTYTIFSILITCETIGRLISKECGLKGNHHFFSHSSSSFYYQTKWMLLRQKIIRKIIAHILGRHPSTCSKVFGIGLREKVVEKLLAWINLCILVIQITKTYIYVFQKTIHKRITQSLWKYCDPREDNSFTV